MENALMDPAVAEPKSSNQIEHDMERTRESITEKVEALENQVLGTIQTATNTVTDTVDSVKEAVTAAPSAVRETLREIVGVAKESLGSLSASECIRSYPAATLGGAAFAGFLLGYLTGGRGGKSVAQPVAAREFAPQAAPPAPSLLGEVFERFGGEVRELAGQALSKALAAVKQNIEKRMPDIVDAAVERMAGSAGTVRTHA